MSSPPAYVAALFDAVQPHWYFMDVVFPPVEIRESAKINGHAVTPEQDDEALMQARQLIFRPAGWTIAHLFEHQTQQQREFKEVMAENGARMGGLIAQVRDEAAKFNDKNTEWPSAPIDRSTRLMFEGIMRQWLASDLIRAPLTGARTIAFVRSSLRSTLHGMPATWTT